MCANFVVIRIVVIVVVAAAAFESARRARRQDISGSRRNIGRHARHVGCGRR